ncbi:hypothetical protein GOHSU_21_00190 [Gordonia hirsuta DSM 44140 = NBRC 16056]|uniref:Carboxyltransferase domain-containing protein n=1 Tax=Gordonia hirsuta DSM 44140 = NBRC 16056 TaxID=1121927 RepID=L7LBU0_9ACTN|nr:carboxyltransferase domain-containing protein [Gordonia hirsuta]GAC57527.1 hypothetical protein GOHSU_21_00190 [Gordonia hirsuta DSM 44140 = NBRC 16056]
MRELPAGDDAVIFDYSADTDPPAAAALAAAVLRAAASAGELMLSDVVPTADAVLVQAPPGAGLDLGGVRRILARAQRPAGGITAGPQVQIPVVYDGADLDEAAGCVGLTAAELVSAHTTIVWRVQFMGFAPGFGYLVPVGGPPAARAAFGALTRRRQSRPAVPPGAVAAAAGYSAVYPSASPGGWFLLGRTDIGLWDVEAQPPALLAAGATVRFQCAD